MSSVLITGAAGHIGFALARHYAAAGWRVFATCLPQDRTEALVAFSRESQGRVTIHDLDVADGAAVRGLATALRDQPIDVLFNVAGLTTQADMVFGETNYDLWDRYFAVNTKGPMRMCEAFAPHVCASERKVMVTISSRIGARPAYGFVGYRASKSAVSQIMFQVGLALKDKGVIAIACHPGWVITAANGGKGALTPEQSAAMLFGVVEKLTPADSGKFFDPDGTTLPLVTQQTEAKPYALA
jgi:NAD(P)-dependent dehydrogenase (short-subunit alcohol dehydrogenase family)